MGPAKARRGAVAGAAKEERFIADAQVKAAAAALGVLERRLEKTTLRAPVDGVVSVIVAEVGENVRAGESVLAFPGNGGSRSTREKTGCMAWWDQGST